MKKRKTEYIRHGNQPYYFGDRFHNFELLGFYLEIYLYSGEIFSKKIMIFCFVE